MAGWILNVLLAAVAAAGTRGAPLTPRPGVLPAAIAWEAVGTKAAQPTQETEVSLEAAVGQALRRWARVTDGKAHRAAQEFLELYGKLRRDTSLAPLTRSTLQMKVRWRLARLAEQIARHHARQARWATGPAAAPKAPAGVAGRLAGGRPAWLGQAAPRAWGRGNGQPGPPAPAGGRGGNLAAPDYGPDLVDLIQQTIAPNSWDVRGGPGSIYYWRPGRAIVVRQTTQVHEAVADALGQLRGADP